MTVRLIIIITTTTTAGSDTILSAFIIVCSASLHYTADNLGEISNNIQHTTQVAIQNAFDMKCLNINNNQRQQQSNIVLSMRCFAQKLCSTYFFSAMHISQQICLKLIYLCPHEYYYNYSLGHNRGILLKYRTVTVFIQYTKTTNRRQYMHLQSYN